MGLSVTILVILVLVTCIGVYWAWKMTFITTLYDSEKGLNYRNGRLVGLVGEGRYVSIRSFSSIERVDLRKQSLYIPAQEVFTKDKIFLKVMLGGQYRIVDPVRARHVSAHAETEFYSWVKMTLRNEVALLTIDEFLDGRKEVSNRIEKIVQASTEELGLVVELLEIKDIIVPASIRRAYASVLEAKKEAQKKLEQARGEQAVLRNLANSSAMYDKNPMLLQARLIQTLANGSNSIVFKAEQGLGLSSDIKQTK